MGRTLWKPAAAVGVLTFLCFLPALQGEFVNWDDDINLLLNPDYRGLSISHLKWMFTTTLGGHYIPVTWMTFGLDFLLWGMNPTGYHLTNLLLHAANAVLVFFLLRALVRRAVHPASETALRWAAAGGALLFSIHPLRVESVAWITERRDVLSAFFLLLTLLLYLRGERGWKWWIAAMGCFVLSLLSKAWGITLPAILLMLDVYPLRRFADGRPWRLILEKVPFAIPAVAAAWIGLLAQASSGATEYASVIGFGDRLLHAGYGLCFHLWKTAAPVGLSPLYLVDSGLGPARAIFIACTLTAVAVTVAVLLMRRRRPALGVAWACTAIVLVPVLGLTQAGQQLTADRYSYLASLPVAALAAAGLLLLRRRRAVGAAAALALATFGIMTVVQSQVWRDSTTLWNQALKVDPRNYRAYASRAHARMSWDDLEGAIADYTSALQINRRFPEAYNNRGVARFQSGDLDGAIADYTEVLRLRPRDARAYYNRAGARHGLGDRAGAVRDLERALSVAPRGWPRRRMAGALLASLKASAVE